MSRTLPHVDPVGLNVCGNHKKRFILTSHIKTLPLTHCKEMSSLVLPCPLTILLVIVPGPAERFQLLRVLLFIGILEQIGRDLKYITLFCL